MPTRVLGAFALVVVVGLLVTASTSSASFGAYNHAWDGTSDLRGVASETSATSQIAHDTAAYSRVTPNGTVGIILSPDENYSATDRARLRRFVRQGGTLLVAGDYGGRTNRLLSALGTDARLDGRPVRDDQRQYRSPALPVADNVSNRSPVANISALTLNHGTVVTPGNATVLVSTSEYAYLDTNGNRKLDDDETISSMPVATVERVGEGRVFVVSDSSIMINTMLGRSDNRAFVRAILDGNRTVLLDYSHTGRLPPLALAVLTLRESALWQLFVGCGCLSFVLLWAQRPEGVSRRWNSLTARISTSDARTTAVSPNRSSDATPSLSESAMVDYLREQHPDWETERIERIVAAYREEQSD